MFLFVLKLLARSSTAITNKDPDSGSPCLTPRLTLEALGGGGGERVKLTPLDFLALNFFIFDRLSKALAQLFLVCELIF